MKKLRGYFTKQEKWLWLSSAALILVSFVLFDRANYLTLTASLIGVTSLIFNAKGNPFGQLLMVIFSLFYGVISYNFAYYCEMITYLGMTMPMAVFALISWLRNPYNGNRAEVKVNRIGRGEQIFMWIITAVVTVVFYFILKHFGTANILPSSLSVTTSFVAVYLTFRRSPFFALAYAANDVVLIVLWVLAAMTDTSYISVIACFVVFLVNDLYGFFCWLKMQKRQNTGPRPGGEPPPDHVRRNDRGRNQLMLPCNMFGFLNLRIDKCLSAE
ncbi:MAG: nicotinamide mononucleotide transporter [Oscillospiraceae bacterium]|nr:nicotinamide mononucleotide transporter [Oscillospiraceae bacterium]